MGTDQNSWAAFGTQFTDVPGLFQLRDAQAAGYAADGYCRATGRPAVVVARGTAEALQVASALVTSWSDRLPVMVVTHQVPEKDRHSTRSAFAAVSQAQITIENRLEPLGRLPMVGPVHVDLAGPVPLEEALRSFSSAPRPEPGNADPQGVEAAIKLLRKSKRPLLLLGRGAIEVDPHHAAELSQIADCPVLLTASATTMPSAALQDFRSAFEHRGALLPSGNLVWVKALARADGILALGTALSEVDWFGLSSLRLVRGTVIRVGLEPADPELAGTFIRAEAGVFLRELLAGGIRPSRGQKVHRWREAATGWREQIAQEASASTDLSHVEPALAAHTIVNGAPDDTLFVSEGGACGMWLWSYLWLRPLLFPVQHGTIGVPMPMTLGAFAAQPDRPVWSIVGDGAFFYSAAELSTLREAGHSPVFFVFNDSCWSAIRLGQTAVFGGRYVGTDLSATDYARIAELHGCQSLSVNTPDDLARAVERARTETRNVPLVVDIKLKKDHVPYAGASFVLAEFDGVLGSLLPQSLLSTGRGLLRGTLPLATLGSLLRVSRT